MMTAQDIFEASDEGNPLLVSRAQVEREIFEHGADFVEFAMEYGERSIYDAAVVLRWLGY